MTNPEQAVRDAAEALHSAVNAAHATGLFVQWPSTSEGLAGILISETAKFARDVDKVEALETPAAADSGPAVEETSPKPSKK